ncbi:MAG: phosphoadenylyl-sulfate reductase [Myxococcales bacterium]|nr:phosphoadenylyl-sulfate reductase [Polyangiaceae bacterium]MDW8249896.1 phosphoadenylyl-sulfate reductase [Myxococcales bacterium]
MRVTELDLVHLNARFEGAPPLELLRFVSATFGFRAALLSSMQKAGTALCYLADRAALSFDVLFVDTGVLHVETIHTRDELARTHPNLRVITLYPDHSFAEQTRQEGLLYLSKEGQERCCYLRKSLPLRRVKGRYDALISALRRGEGGARAKVQPFGLDPEMGALRVHPFHALSNDELEELVSRPGLVLNPLHEMGYPTIGCFPCTTPVLPNEPERAGRWRHLANVTYCGINPVDRGKDDDVGIDLDDRYRVALFGGSA